MAAFATLVSNGVREFQEKQTQPGKATPHEPTCAMFDNLRRRLADTLFELALADYQYCRNCHLLTL